TNRLQLMGVNNTMVLNVWFDKNKNPFEFKIGGEFLPGDGAVREARVKVKDKSGNVMKDKDGKEVEEVSLVPANVLDIIPTGTPTAGKDNVIPATFGSTTEIVRV